MQRSSTQESPAWSTTISFPLDKGSLLTFDTSARSLAVSGQATPSRTEARFTTSCLEPAAGRTVVPQKKAIVSKRSTDDFGVGGSRGSVKSEDPFAVAIRAIRVIRG